MAVAGDQLARPASRQNLEPDGRPSGGADFGIRPHSTDGPVGRTSPLTVVGDAGIGKSRLARELTDRLADETTVLTGRCLSYGEDISVWPLREALTQAAGGESRDAITKAAR